MQNPDGSIRSSVASANLPDRLKGISVILVVGPVVAMHRTLRQPLLQLVKVPVGKSLRKTYLISWEAKAAGSASSPEALFFKNLNPCTIEKAFAKSARNCR